MIVTSRCHRAPSRALRPRQTHQTRQTRRLGIIPSSQFIIERLSSHAPVQGTSTSVPITASQGHTMAVFRFPFVEVRTSTTSSSCCREHAFPRHSAEQDPARCSTVIKHGAFALPRNLQSFDFRLRLHSQFSILPAQQSMTNLRESNVTVSDSQFPGDGRCY
jgi:hypothetical protein